MEPILELMNFSLRWSLPIQNRIPQFASVLLLLALMAGVASATTTTKPRTKHSQVTRTNSSSHHSGKSKTSASRSHGQRGIDQQRTMEIQSALIREHYLTGGPSGTWDEEVGSGHVCTSVT